MRQYAVRLAGAVSLILAGLALLTVTISWATADSAVVRAAESVAESVAAPDSEEQARLETEVARLEDELRLSRRYDKVLRVWVAEELRPWVIKRAEIVAEALPSTIPEPPLLAPVPPVPTLPPTSTPIPIPDPIPTEVPSPSVEPTPDPIPDPCLPVVCSPSLGATPGSISMGVMIALIIWFVPWGSW